MQHDLGHICNMQCLVKLSSAAKEKKIVAIIKIEKTDDRQL